MSTLIFGGTGLIGTAVARALVGRGERTFVFSRRPPGKDAGATEWIEGDIVDAAKVADAVRSSDATRIVHLAALLQFACERDPKLAAEINVQGTLNVLEAARAARIKRVVFGSSIAVFGDRTELLTEDAPPGPSVSFYGRTKRFGEQLGAAYKAAHGIEFVALRYCGVFGPGDVKGPGMARVRKSIERTADGHSIAIEGAGGDERAQLLYVEDAALATLAALDHPKPPASVYNLAGPAENYISLRQYHAEVRALVPTAGDVRFTGKARDMGPVDIGRIAADLGFRPTCLVRDGLRKILRPGSL